MNKICFNVFATVVIINCVTPSILSGDTMAAGHNVSDSSQRILSRGRRYLIFPEGSSLQLGIHTTNSVHSVVLLLKYPVSLLRCETIQKFIIHFGLT